MNIDTNKSWQFYTNFLLLQMLSAARGNEREWRKPGREYGVNLPSRGEHQGEVSEYFPPVTPT